MRLAVAAALVKLMNATFPVHPAIGLLPTMSTLWKALVHAAVRAKDAVMADVKQLVGARTFPHVGSRRRIGESESALHGLALGALQFDSSHRSHGGPIGAASHTKCFACTVRLWALELNDVAHFGVSPWKYFIGSGCSQLALTVMEGPSG